MKYESVEINMAEFCRDCFLKLNPEFDKSDLVMCRGEELCEVKNYVKGVENG